MSCEDEDRDQDDVSTNQETPKACQTETSLEQSCGKINSCHVSCPICSTLLQWLQQTDTQTRAHSCTGTHTHTCSRTCTHAQVCIYAYGQAQVHMSQHTESSQRSALREIHSFKCLYQGKKFQNQWYKFPTQEVRKKKRIKLKINFKSRKNFKRVPSQGQCQLQIDTCHLLLQ